MWIVSWQVHSTRFELADRAIDHQFASEADVIVAAFVTAGLQNDTIAVDCIADRATFAHTAG